MQLPGPIGRAALRVRLRTQTGAPLSRTRVVLAVKAAGAAVIAWYVAALTFDDVSYPYYAPLGAVLAMGFSVAASVRDSLRAIGAILLGLGIAIVCDYALGSSVAGVALVIGVGVLVAGWHRLDGQGTWVPTSALFVLILADDSNVVEYVGSYGGLTLLGMVIGVAVNAAFPAHPLARFDAVATRLRHRLADQWDALADGLSNGAALLSADEWEDHRDDMLPVIADVRAITQETAESSRGNLRARWHQNNADLQYAYAQLLERIAFQSDALTQLIAEGERSENRVPVLGELRGSAAGALRSLAAVLRMSETTDSTGRHDDARRSVAHAHRELRALETGIQHLGDGSRAPKFYASAIAVEIRTALRTSATLVFMA